LSDAQLDRDIESALGIEPSPQFLVRVRARIASEPALVVESGFSRIRRLSFEPLAAVAIVGIVLAIVVPQFMREDMTRPSADRVARGVVGAPVVGAPVGADLSTSAQDYRGPAGPPVTVDAVSRRVAPEARISEPRTLPLQLSPVLIDDDERRAFEFFIAAVSQGRVPEEVVKRPAESRVETVLLIEPLEIAPLPPLARMAQEGEGQWE
jgi:hypothetical protein